jgi:fructokinase
MTVASNPLYGGIEAGGTKFVCTVGRGPEDIRALTHFPTTTPSETLRKAQGFFRREMEKEPLAAIGIASFGPLDLNPASNTYGYITATPKAGWSRIDIVGRVREALGIPVLLDTDVNLAALGEGKWGAAQGLNTFLYLTVGTGIGGGGLSGGSLMHGLIHPEIGHIRLPHNRQTDPFPGSCPFHGDCWEGLASGEAIRQRWGQAPEAIPSDHQAWALEGHYLALGISNLICTLSPQRIIVGGGVMKNSGLLPVVRGKVKEFLNGYIRSTEITDRLENYLVPPALGDLSGVLGAIALAQNSP